MPAYAVAVAIWALARFGQSHKPVKKMFHRVTACRIDASKVAAASVATNVNHAPGDTALKNFMSCSYSANKKAHSRLEFAVNGLDCDRICLSIVRPIHDDGSAESVTGSLHNLMCSE